MFKKKLWKFYSWVKILNINTGFLTKISSMTLNKLHVSLDCVTNQGLQQQQNPWRDGYQIKSFVKSLSKKKKIRKNTLVSKSTPFITFLFFLIMPCEGCILVHVISIYIIQCCFLRNEQPSVSRAFPPVGWHRTVEHPTHKTTVWAWLNTVVIL